MLVTNNCDADIKNTTHNCNMSSSCHQRSWQCSSSRKQISRTLAVTETCQLAVISESRINVAITFIVYIKKLPSRQQQYTSTKPLKRHSGFNNKVSKHKQRHNVQLFLHALYISKRACKKKTRPIKMNVG